MSATPSLKPVQPDRQTREQIAQMTLRCSQQASTRLNHSSHKGNPAMNEATPPLKRWLSPFDKYVLEKATLIATAHGTDLKQAVNEVLEAIALLNGRLYPATDGPR